MKVRMTTPPPLWIDVLGDSTHCRTAVEKDDDGMTTATERTTTDELNAK